MTSVSTVLNSVARYTKDLFDHTRTLISIVSETWQSLHAGLSISFQPVQLLAVGIELLRYIETRGATYTKQCGSIKR